MTYTSMVPNISIPMSNDINCRVNQCIQGKIPLYFTSIAAFCPNRSEIRTERERQLHPLIKEQLVRVAVPEVCVPRTPRTPAQLLSPSWHRANILWKVWQSSRSGANRILHNGELMTSAWIRLTSTACHQRIVSRTEGCTSTEDFKWVCWKPRVNWSFKFF